MERWDKITMGQVSKLIERNKEFASELDLRLAFGITHKKFYAAIFNSDAQIFYRTYEGEHAHILIAMLHSDLSDHLKKVDTARKRAESVRLQAERNAERERMIEADWQEELERRKERFRESGLLE